MGSTARLPYSLSSLQSFLRRFSSASSPGMGPGGPAEGSVAYRLSMLRRPDTVMPWRSRWNSCSFIGTVVRPVKRFGGSEPSRGAYTFLELNRPSGDSDRSPLQILLAMQNKLAEISLQHLKTNDFIYVRGFLGSYEKVNGSGKHDTYFKVSVTNLNYIKCNYQNPSSQKPVSSRADNMAVPTSSALDQRGAPYSSALDHEEECIDRHHLWQIFFANPLAWWDNRHGKRNPRSPDFKHKDTRECLWLNPDDPPWVGKQLQLYDSKMLGGHQWGLGGHLHEWNLEDLE